MTPLTGTPPTVGPCIWQPCVATWRHWHGGFPGGYDNPADPDGPPIPFEGDDPDPDAVRDYNGAALPKVGSKVPPLTGTPPDLPMPDPVTPSTEAGLALRQKIAMSGGAWIGFEADIADVEQEARAAAEAQVRQIRDRWEQAAKNWRQAERESAGFTSTIGGYSDVPSGALSLVRESMSRSFADDLRALLAGVDTGATPERGGRSEAGDQ